MNEENVKMFFCVCNLKIFFENIFLIMLIILKEWIIDWRKEIKSEMFYLL